MKRAFTLIEALVVISVLAIAAAIFFQPRHHNRRYARRMVCQSNLKNLSMAFQTYAADHNDFLPPRAWVKPIVAYTKSDQLFQCPEIGVARGTSDYFFNARFQHKRLAPIKSPKTLILFGDGQADAPLDATLTQLPASWRTDENSPSFRHLDTANYLFADGHVKSLKVKAVSRDFRWLSK